MGNEGELQQSNNSNGDASAFASGITQNMLLENHAVDVAKKNLAATLEVTIHEELVVEENAQSASKKRIGSASIS